MSVKLRKNRAELEMQLGKNRFLLVAGALIRFPTAHLFHFKLKLLDSLRDVLHRLDQVVSFVELAGEVVISHALLFQVIGSSFVVFSERVYSG